MGEQRSLGQAIRPLASTLMPPKSPNSGGLSSLYIEQGSISKNRFPKFWGTEGGLILSVQEVYYLGDVRF